MTGVKECSAPAPNGFMIDGEVIFHTNDRDTFQLWEIVEITCADGFKPMNADVLSENVTCV